MSHLPATCKNKIFSPFPSTNRIESEIHLSFLWPLDWGSKLLIILGVVTQMRRSPSSPMVPEHLGRNRSDCSLTDSGKAPSDASCAEAPSSCGSLSAWRCRTLFSSLRDLLFSADYDRLNLKNGSCRGMLEKEKWLYYSCLNLYNWTFTILIS